MGGTGGRDGQPVASRHCSLKNNLEGHSSEKDGTHGGSSSKPETGDMLKFTAVTNHHEEKTGILDFVHGIKPKHSGGNREPAPQLKITTGNKLGDSWREGA